jgi:hypothetical protein
MLFKRVLLLQFVCSVLLVLQLIYRVIIPFHLVACFISVNIILIGRRFCHIDIQYNYYLIIVYFYRLILYFFLFEFWLLWVFYYLLLMLVAICLFFKALRIIFWW